MKFIYNVIELTE